MNANSSARQQAYDRGHTIFSPDGRLYQVEYAREAVERGSPSLGVRTAEGTVLAARKPVRSSLLEPDTVEKVHRIDDHLAIASAGHAADARQLVEFAREAGQRHRLRYGEPVGVESLTKTIADRVQEYTQTGGSRPYGTALLVAGVDGADRARTNASRLFEIDPSGTPYGWRAVAIGNGAGELRRVLEERLESDATSESEEESGGETGSESEFESESGIESERRPELELGTVDQGIETALEALETTADGPLTTDELDVYAVESATNSVSRVSEGALADALESVRSSGPAS